MSWIPTRVTDHEDGIHSPLHSNDVFLHFRTVHIINNTMQIVTAELLTSGVVVDIFPSQAFSWPIEGLTHSEFFPILFKCHRARRMFEYVSAHVLDTGPGMLTVAKVVFEAKELREFSLSKQ